MAGRPGPAVLNSQAPSQSAGFLCHWQYVVVLNTIKGKRKPPTKNSNPPGAKWLGFNYFQRHEKDSMDRLLVCFCGGRRVRSPFSGSGRGH
jgi:hypothetical protein